MTTSHIIVTPKRSVLDPQGEAVKRALHSLGLKTVKNVRVGKFIELELDESISVSLRERLMTACHDLISNPVIEDYRLVVFNPKQVTPPQSEYEGLSDPDENPETERELVKLEARPKKAAKIQKKAAKAELSLKEEKTKKQKGKKKEKKKKDKKKEKIKEKTKGKKAKPTKTRELKDLSEARTKK